MSHITFPLLTSGGEPYYLQLYRHILKEIQKGGLQAGEKLPSKRTLAQHLSVSVNTVDAAYQMLTTEGYLRAAPKSGFYVCPLPQLPTPQRPLSPLPPPEIPKTSFPFDCSPGSADPSAFPFATWGKLTREVMGQGELLSKGEAQGDLCLRQALCRYLHQYRGVQCQPHQVLIGAGMEYLLTLLCCLLPTETVYAMEEPGYPKAAQSFRNLGRKVVHIPVDKDGMDSAKLEESGACCAYLTPSHQFPTGGVMPAPRRAQMLRWAAEQEGRYLIEDDYDSEYRYAGRPIPALQGSDLHDRVIYCGTFSRSLAPSIRIAYLVLPVPLLPAYHRLFSLQSSTVSRFEQHTLCRFLEEGYWERHLNRTRILYKKRREELTSSLKASPLGPNLEILGSQAGLHFLLRFHGGLSEEEMARKAREQGVDFLPLSHCYHDPTLAPPSTLLCGYGRLPLEEIPALTQALVRAWTN